MHRSFSSLVIATGVGLIAASTIGSPQTAQAQMAQAQMAQTQAATTYKEQYDEITAYADKNCAMQMKKVKKVGRLNYRICRIKGVVMTVSLDGPEGDNGPTAYFKNGRLYSFRDTGRGEAWVFQNGKLMAEVEVGVVAPDDNTITTDFSTTLRREITARATSSTRDMLKVFGAQLRL
jgi:hypothetical protein